MEHGNPNNGETQSGNGSQKQRYFEDIDSSCSTPYVSAPSSPGRGPMPAGYFFSAPASPMHYVLSSSPYSAANSGASAEGPFAGSFEFEFSAEFPTAGETPVGSMISADELFFNGQIRPMKLSSHLKRPQTLAPLLDVEFEDEDDDGKAGDPAVEVVRGRELRTRSRSMQRRTRSMSPMRNPRFQWEDDEDDDEGGVDLRKSKRKDLALDLEADRKPAELEVATPSDSASSSRSSSSGRNSKKWIFLKDLLYRSKSEGRANGKEKFWHSISFSPSSKEKSKAPPPILPSPETSKPPPQQKKKKTKDAVPPPPSAAQGSAAPKKSGSGSSSKPTNGVGKRRGPLPSAHERHYTAKRAQAEELRRRTFLPYRQGLLGCLGFSSRGYGAVNGFARVLNPVSSR